MAFFSRRSLQTRLKQLVAILPPGSRRQLANALNSKKPQENAGAQWEVAVLSALSRLGTPHAVINTPNQRITDLVVETAGGVTAGFEVTALSNVEHVKSHGIDAFFGWFFERLEREGMSTGEWAFEFDFKCSTLGKSTQFVPAAPRGTAVLEEFRHSHLRGIFAQIKKSPRESYSFKIREPEYSFTLEYKPGEDSVLTSNASSSNDVSSNVDNALWRRLEKKSSQLRAAGLAGPRIVIACDAGYRLFAQSKRSYTVTARTVCEEYLRSDRSLCSILLLRTTDSNTSLIGRHPLAELVLSPFNGEAVQLPEQHVNEGAVRLPEQLAAQLVRIGEQLPILRTDGVNFLNHFSGQRDQRSFRYFDNPWRFEKVAKGMSFMSKVSARGVVEVLSNNPIAGDGTHLVHGFNTFADMVRLGRRLRNVSLIRDDEADDDWIQFEFEEESDPAVSEVDCET